MFPQPMTRSLLLALFAATALLAQTPAPDIDRALAFAKQTEGKVFRAKVEPHWLPDGQRFWYRVQSGAKTWEYVLVDAATGKITRAADAATLALPKQALTTTAATTRVRPTQRTGDATTVSFTNETGGTIELFWVNQQGERKSYGKIAAGETRDINTYAGHVWLVADAKGETLAVVEATDNALELTIDGKGQPAAPAKAPPRDTSPAGRCALKKIRSCSATSRRPKTRR